jgi:hypothetical protein
MIDTTQTKRGPGRPPVTDEEMGQINVRLPLSDIEWLSREADRMGRIGRNAVLRLMIRAARAQKRS